MAIPISEAVMRRKRGKDVFCLYWGLGITDNGEHLETGVFLEPWNFHGNKYRS